MGLFMYVTEIYTYYLVFSHSLTLLHVNGCKINCSMDVNTIFFFPSIAMAHDQHNGAILLWSLCLSKVGRLLRISRAMLKVEHSFELRNLYSPRFIESEICLLLFEYETQTEPQKKDSDFFIVTSSEFPVY